MSNLHSAIQFHLGRDVDVKSLTYYSLLGVEPNAAPEVIKQHFASAAKRWNQSDRQSNPEAAKQVGSLLKEAQKILLNEKLRAEYDSKLRQKRTAAKVANRPKTSPQASNDDLEKPFSADDFSQPFDEALFLKNHSPQFLPSWQPTSAEESYARLLNYLHSGASITVAMPNRALTETAPDPEASSSALATATLDAATPTAEERPIEDDGLSTESQAIPLDVYTPYQFSTVSQFVTDDSDPFFFSNASPTDTTIEPETSPSLYGSFSPNLSDTDPLFSAPAPKIVSRHRVNPRQKLVTSICIAVGGLLIAGVGFYAFQGGQRQASHSPSNASSTPSNGLDSGTATPTGLENQTSMFPPSSESPSLPSDGFQGTQNANSAATDIPPMDNSETTLSKNGSMETNESSIPDLTTSGMNTDSEASMSDASTENIQEPTQPQFDKSMWDAQIAQASEALKRLDFQTFEQQVQLLNIQTGDQTLDAKAARLLQRAAFAKLAHESYQQAEANLRAGDSIEVGGRVLTIASIDADQITFQLMAGPKAYSRESLPMGIQIGILEKGLPSSTPENAAAQASYLGLALPKNALVERKIEELLEQAQGGSVRADFKEVFTDTYP